MDAYDSEDVFELSTIIRLILRQVETYQSIFGMRIATLSRVVLRIEKSKSKNREFVVFTLSGRMEHDHISDLQKILALARANQKIAIDLTDVKLLDQESVEFLEQSETNGVELWNCPAFLREWIARIRAANGRTNG